MRKMELYLRKKLKRETSSGNYIPEMDGLRFLAIMGVILVHAQYFLVAKTPFMFVYENGWFYKLLQNGFKGVQLFFVISGFILALPFVNYYVAGGKKPSLKKFYARRLTRLEPPYMIALILFFTLHVIKGVYPIQDLFGGLFLNAIYLQNFAWYNAVPIIGAITWTLEIEVQFYLVAPFLAYVFLLKKNLRRTLLVSAILGIPALNIIWPPIHLSLYNHLYYFLIGFLIADIYVTSEKDRLKSGPAFLIGSIAFLFFILINIDFFFNRLIFLVALYVFVYLVVMSSVWRRVFSFGLFTTIGGMCYTIYLFHTVIISGVGNITVFWKVSSSYEWYIILQTLILLFPILGISAIYFLLVEKPCMNRLWPQQLFYFAKKSYTNYFIRV